MHELPSHVLLQQAHARPVSGEELEVFGKHAANLYLRCQVPLNQAVVETVKHAGLSPEQVRRVVEFANVNAYLEEFKKEGSHKYVDFQGGPASVSEVLKDLNDGGGGTVFDRGRSDYAQPPLEKRASELRERNRARLGLEKAASASREEEVLAQLFQVKDEPLPYAEPFADSTGMREKLADLRAQLTGQLSELELDYHDISEGLYHAVKQAALSGVSLGQVVQAWREVTPGSGFVKAAFQLIGPRLLEDGVFSPDDFGKSLEKTASGALVNPSHPLVQGFSLFCDRLQKLAEVRAEREQVDDAYRRVDWFLKQASVKQASVSKALARVAGEGGLIPKAWRGLGRAGEVLAGSAEKPGFPPALVGAIGGPRAQEAARTVVRHAPQTLAGLGAAIGAKELWDRGIVYGPGRLPIRIAASHIPGTREYYTRQFELQQRGWLM